MSGTDPGDDPSLPLSQLERVVATCDRFEAAWRAGQRPRVEDYLGDLPDPERPALLRELLAMELEWRRRCGEQPTPREYRARLPGYSDLINAAFGPAPLSIHPQADHPPAAGPRAEAARHLLFGILALQNNFIDRDVAAGRLQRLGRGQVPGPGPDPGRARRLGRGRARAAGGTRRQVPEATR